MAVPVVATFGSAIIAVATGTVLNARVRFVKNGYRPGKQNCFPYLISM
jgi:hypothetical protein